jgi:hypothetical protein
MADDSDFCIVGESSNETFAEKDALTAVAAGKANRILIVKVLSVVERTAQVMSRRKVAT